LEQQKKRIAVFCGSRLGNDPKYIEAGKLLALAMVENNYDLVYGGGKIGLMGVIADEVLLLGGKVYGVIPEKLQSLEVGHHGITELHIVASMHERKAMMAEMSDAFIAMSGGIGTLEEIIEVFTWKQIGYHNKPCSFLDTDNYFLPLFEMLQKMISTGFLDQKHLTNLIIEHQPEILIAKINADLSGI
jgi:uncharacterized protein (TIGR00730 family)